MSTSKIVIMSENLMEHQIDVFVEIIDNYGDIGWVEELIRGSLGTYKIRIITGTPDKVKAFFLRNQMDENTYTIIPEDVYDSNTCSSIVILAFHKKINTKQFPEKTLFLRINYLSFQDFSRKIHLRQHIDSTSTRPIIEVSYSPLSETGGLIISKIDPLKKSEWAQKQGFFSTLSDKKWRMIFVYSPTRERLSFDEEDTVYFIIGVSDGEKKSLPQGTMVEYIPWLPSEKMWNLLSICDGSIIRGEVSLVRGLFSEKPFYWDMYKEIGGLNRDESVAFLNWRNASESYRSGHHSLNEGIGMISMKDLFNTDFGALKQSSSIPDFIDTLEKTIDTYRFSI